MNVAAHQEKKNEVTKTGKRKAGKKRRAIDFKETTCCPSAVGKKMVCARGKPFNQKND